MPDRNADTAAESNASGSSDDTGAPWWRRGAVGWTLDLFSSVKFGIWLLAILFVYSSIGSAGIVYPESANIFSADGWAHDQLRQWRGLEMTEFEWFHWWPFDLMMILIALNIAVTTVRRIPFKPVNYGVWMIHAGILVLIVGSFIYFGTKVEGDTPVARRKVVARFAADDGATQTVEFVAAPGARAEGGAGASRATFEVTSIDPEWELLTGDAKGERAYSVTVAVERGGKRYLRQLIAGRPDLTEDLIFTGEEEQPVKRSVKETGKPIYDDGLAMDLAYEPQEWFYLRNELVKSWALYVRKPGDPAWVERRIDGLPLYNDYVPDRELVFQSSGDTQLPVDPLDIAVKPTSPDDPFPDVDFTVSGYLRYATPERSSFVDGPATGPLNPVAFLTIDSDRGESAKYRLVALDPERSVADGGLLRMAHVASEGEVAAFSRQPTLVIRIPGRNIEVREEIRDVAAANPEAPFVEIQGSGGGRADYAYRVMNVRDGVPVGGGRVSLAILEVRTPKGLFRRWVFDDPSLTRDVVQEDAADAHGPPTLQDDSIQITYEPGNGLALLTVVHGPEEGRVRLVSAIGAGTTVQDMKVRNPLKLAGGITVKLEQIMPRAVLETKPLVVPREQRERDALEMFSQLRVAAPGAPAQWLPFNRWVFNSPQEALRRAPYEPRTMRLADGREVEVLFSRQRLPLRTDIALEEFVLGSHVGGFTGETGSIRDYMSRLRFRDPGQSAWEEPVNVSVNNPIEHKGLWYFQAQWDPPDEARESGVAASRGLNYTVLGVGNRNGVYIQLLGCVIAVAGMIYAFYVKPVIKRRRQEEVLAGLARNGRKVPA